MKTAHVFYYRFPRIKEGLRHETVQFTWGMPQVAQDEVPIGGYVLLDGEWYLKGFPASPGMKTLIANPTLVPVKYDHVPAPIRATALLLI